MNNDDISEKREKCLKLLDLYIDFYEEAYRVNFQNINKCIQNILNKNFPNYNKEFMIKIRYAFSMGFKMFMTTKNLGQFVDYESYKSFKERTKNNLPVLLVKAIAPYEAYNKVLARVISSLKICRDKLKNDNTAVIKFYNLITSNEDVLNPGILVDKIIKVCGLESINELNKYSQFVLNEESKCVVPILEYLNNEFYGEKKSKTK